jgi:hypothetical protein
MPPLSSNEHGRVRRTARRPGPNIDQLAAGGIRFNRCYVSCPVCSPCRSAKLTDKIFFGPRPAEELYDLNQWKKACVNPESDRIRK